MSRVRGAGCRYLIAAALVWVLMVAAAGQTASAAAPRADAGADGHIIPAERPVPDQYIVTLHDQSDTAELAETASLAERHNSQVLHVYSHAVHGFAARMSPADAQALAADPDVAAVEQDGVVSIDEAQVSPPSWGLDRVDQHDLPLDNQYSYLGDGTDVHAYVIDTGVRTTHTDFGGRASTGVDEVGGVPCNPVTQPKSGHGTHVAGTIGGSTYGLAKNVSVVSVRVLDCSGSGLVSQVVAGVDWVTAHAIKPAVANLSLGGGTSATMDSAVSNSIASGVTYAIAAGNSALDACTSSPGDVPAALTVAATTSTDSRDTTYSNFGSCVDLFAPGTGITSDWNTGDTDTAIVSGTSMAAPHVAGVVARYLATNPCATTTSVASAIVGNATLNKVTNAGTGSPNRLLYSGFLGPNAAPVLPPCTGPNVTLTADYNTVHLGWTIPSDGGSPITGYSIYRSTTPGGEGGVPLATVSGVSTTNYDDVTAFGGVTYYYQVAAVNARGETRSSEQSVTSLTPTAPTAPVVTATAGNTAVHLAWPTPGSGGSALTGFVVSRGTSAGAEAPLGGSLPPTATSFDDISLTNGKTYFYKVTAQNAIGSTASAEVSATPRGLVGVAGRIDVFGRNSTNSLNWQRIAGGTSQPIVSMGGTVTSNPAAVSDGTGTAVFVRGPDGGLWWQRIVGGVASGWMPLGGFLTSDPVAYATGSEVGVFVLGGDKAIYWQRIAGTVASGVGQGYVSLGGTGTSTPATASIGATKFVVVRGTTGAVFYQRFSGPSPTGGWQSLGGYITADPSVTSDNFGGGGVTVFARGADLSEFSQHVSSAGAASSWVALGGNVTSTAAAASDGASTFVFVRGADNSVFYQRFTSPAAGTGWVPLGGVATTDPKATFDGTYVGVVVGSTDTGYYWLIPNVIGWTPLGGSYTSDPAIAAAN